MYEDEIPVGKAENLKGQIFDKLTVLYRTHNEGKRPAWKCQCECGNTVIKRADVLKTQKQLSCPECMVGNRRLNLINQRFGKLMVLEQVGQDKYSRLIWKCKCDCGNIVIVRSTCLVQGTVKSCGCLNKDTARKLRLKDIAGQQFGKLKVLEIDETISAENKRIYWKCRCDCGNIVSVQASHLIGNKTHSCGCLNSSWGEIIIRDILDKNNIVFEEQKVFSDCRFKDTNWPARFDFYIDKKYIIEFDGIQHFKYNNSGWDTKEHFQKTQEHDAYKNQWCKENNIPLIRIPYTKLNTLTIKDLKLETTQFRVV